MKRYQTKDKSLYVLLIKNYVVFTLVMAILMLILYFAEGWAERRILQPPRRNGALGGQNLLLSGEFEKLSMEKLLELMVYNPRERFGLPVGDSFSVWALDEVYDIDPDEFKSQGKATPFEGDRVFAKCVATVSNGKRVF